MILANLSKILQMNVAKLIAVSQIECIHSSTNTLAWSKEITPKKWLTYNKVIYPPQEAHEERRPAFVCHQRTNIKYSPWKMWYIACLVRGMTIDEAIKQLNFVHKKGAIDVRQTIEEARDLAITHHNVEFASNLWIAESFVGKGQVFTGIRRHARKRYGKIQYIHCHYFVRLEEGIPPKDYYQPALKEPSEQLNDWLEQMRKRKITNSL